MAKTAPRSQGRLTRRAEQSFITRRVVMPVNDFLHTEGVGGVVLLGAALLALAWANSPWRETYFHIWEVQLGLQIGDFSFYQALHEWINDGLMAVFFYVVGLEIKRELVQGELSGIRRAALPVAAALGGMVAPALIYFSLNTSGETASGWGIPMATDIAFAVGVLALLGTRVPAELRVFLLALAIVDDLGAILVIAVFYTAEVSFLYLLAGAGLMAVIVLMLRLGVVNRFLYGLAAALFWLAIFKSGVHATVAGVLLALVTPLTPRFRLAAFESCNSDLLGQLRSALRDNETGRAENILGSMDELIVGTESALARLERTLHPWSSFFILPLFAFANSGIVLSMEVMSHALNSSVTQGVVLGLTLGKIVGIVVFSWLAVRFGLARLPGAVTWPHVVGVATLGGIGFTVSLFISSLAFRNSVLVDDAKIGILAASLLAGTAGYLWLRLTSRAPAVATRAAGAAQGH